MNQELTKELAKKLMAVEGETRGFNLRHDGEYILKERGKEGLEKVEKELERLGYPIKYRELQDMAFYPAGLRALSLLAIQKALGFDDEKLREVCAFHPKTPLVVRLFMKYFYSLPKTLKASPRLWREYWTRGNLSAEEFSEEGKYVIMKLEDFDLHPAFCRCVEGYLESIGEMLVKSPKVTCKETKCSFKGSRYHQFLIKWQ